VSEMKQETLNRGEDTVPIATAASLDELSGAAASGGEAPLDTLLEVMLPVVIEFGNTKMSVQDVLGLGSGSVIQLDQAVGEPVQVYIGDQKFAEGEVVVIGEFFGVRVTRLFGQQDNGSAKQ
jgi:flagellar motor switch protein FliN